MSRKLSTFGMVVSCIGIAFAWTISLPAAIQETLASVLPPAAQHRALLNRYCVTCHSEQLRTAELTLEKIDVAKVSEGAEVWEKVIRKLRTSAMPPAGLPRPSPAAYDSFATYLETELDRAAAANPNPGRPSIQRLNRAEYANAIRDLLALEIDGGSLLPADDSRYGFDNVGDVLTVSPLLLERYMSAGRKISRLAIGDSSALPSFETYNVPRYLLQDDHMGDDLPFGTRGGTAIRHYFPLDGEYVIRIRLQKNSRAYIRGLGEPTSSTSAWMAQESGNSRSGENPWGGRPRFFHRPAWETSRRNNTSGQRMRLWRFASLR